MGLKPSKQAESVNTPILRGFTTLLSHWGRWRSSKEAENKGFSCVASVESPPLLSHKVPEARGVSTSGTKSQDMPCRQQGCRPEQAALCRRWHVLNRGVRRPRPLQMTEDGSPAPLSCEVLRRPLSSAICMGVQPSWMRKSIRLLSSMVICFAILAVLSFCFATSLVRTRRLEGVETERMPYLQFARLNAPYVPREVIRKEISVRQVQSSGIPYSSHE